MQPGMMFLYHVSAANTTGVRRFDAITNQHAKTIDVSSLVSTTVPKAIVFFDVSFPMLRKNVFSVKEPVLTHLPTHSQSRFL